MNIKEVFHSINLKRKNFFADLLESSQLNMMQLEILSYLHEFPDNNTFTEIMKSKDYARSQISAAITGLIQQGFLKKEPHPGNRKVFFLILQEKSSAIVEDYAICNENFEKVALVGITEEEKELFEIIYGKIQKNLANREYEDEKSV